MAWDNNVIQQAGIANHSGCVSVLIIITAYAITYSDRFLVALSIQQFAPERLR